jgi:hypothetical protein
MAQFCISFEAGMKGVTWVQTVEWSRTDPDAVFELPAGFSDIL